MKWKVNGFNGKLKNFFTFVSFDIHFSKFIKRIQGFKDLLKTENGMINALPFAEKKLKIKKEIAYCIF